MKFKNPWIETAGPLRNLPSASEATSFLSSSSLARKNASPCEDANRGVKTTSDSGNDRLSFQER